MAVPNTNTFSLQDVVDEVNPTTDDLVDCFADAIASKFDSAYSGSKNQLLNFRNYGASGNLLEVATTSSGFPPVYFAFISNESTAAQTFTYTWEYVGQSGDIDTTVTYNGTARSPGYTTPTLSDTFSSGDLLAFYVPFSFSGGNATTVECEFTLISASIDTVPSSPDNKTTVYVAVNF